MLGISGTELLFIGVFAFLIFGPDKLPEIMKTVNSAIKMFKSTQEDMERLIKAEVAGLDLEKPLFSLDDKPEETKAPAAAEKPSTASSLYGLYDDDEEDEE